MERFSPYQRQTDPAVRTWEIEWQRLLREMQINMNPVMRKLAEENEQLRAALQWSLRRLVNARNCGYGGVELEEIEERERLLTSERQNAQPR